ncbi:uncharacterized protein V2V93DRAFT_321992 [Kockiozyma suomiensis]|uniref:uncharacterized protein n=1 Tax=Kockiozyma suomiensis TaxID=1337062 RepID=UPI00334388D1
MRSDRRASPLYLSARSNALHFYDPSPQRRHLRIPDHFPRQSLSDSSLPSASNVSIRGEARTAFYQLFVDELSVAAELSIVDAASSSGSNSSSANSSTASLRRPRPHALNYRSLLDPDDDRPDAADAAATHASLSSDSGSESLSSDSSDSDDDGEDAVDSYVAMMRTSGVVPSNRPALPLAAVTSSGASIRSFRSSLSARRLFPSRRAATLDSLPLELLDEICSYLPQKALLASVLTCKNIACAGYVFLYQNPAFKSTYRFAQFVSIITHDRTLSSYVRSLDLSEIESGLQGNVVLAGWRDWKYRSEPLYWNRKHHRHHHHHHSKRKRANTADAISSQQKIETTRPSMRRSSLSFSSSSRPKQQHHHSQLQSIQQHKQPVQLRSIKLPQNAETVSAEASADVRHPLQSPLLKQYSLSRDLPIGAILHVLRACPKLQTIDLSNLPLAADYYVTSRKYKPTAFTNLLFVSDVPKSYTWRADETVQVSAPRELVSALLELRELRELRMRGLVWVNKEIVKRLLEHERLSETLNFVDFEECGMSRGRPWAKRGKVSDFSEVLRDEE